MPVLSPFSWGTNRARIIVSLCWSGHLSPLGLQLFLKLSLLAFCAKQPTITKSWMLLPVTFFHNFSWIRCDVTLLIVAGAVRRCPATLASR